MNETRLTNRQAAILTLYTGITCGPFGDAQLLADEIMGRPIFTHEFASEDFYEEIKAKVKPLFLEICAKKFDHK